VTKREKSYLGDDEEDEEDEDGREDLFSLDEEEDKVKEVERREEDVEPKVDA
jgi:hypothetical protein